MRLVRVTALFCQGLWGCSVNYVTRMKTVTYNSATFVMAVIILPDRVTRFTRRQCRQFAP
ncbi:hypothetical protein JOJ88_003840 [Pantoea cypripedii]|nr:hypothetical protein [Pantoea cypripedii]